MTKETPYNINLGNAQMTRPVPSFGKPSVTTLSIVPDCQYLNYQQPDVKHSQSLTIVCKVRELGSK